MTTKTIRIITAAAIGFALAVPATAFACGGKDGGARESHFQKADKNNDGFLTQAEVGAQRWEHMKIADVNNDNKVSKEELKQAFEGTGRGEHGDRFQKADKNNDGFLTQAEVGAQRWERIKVADANNDGKVSKDEMTQAFKAGKLGRRHDHKSAS
jgi:Ca2+-binding EF-hand superfamily protein